MALPPPPLPDPVPLREALRGLRHALRSGRETLAGTAPLDVLPREAALALKTGDQIARRLDHVASQVLRRFLGTGAPDQASLQDFADRGAAAAGDFAGFCYVGLSLILDRLGVTHAFISEAAAQQAWLRVIARAPVWEMPRLSAALYLELRDQRVLRDLEPEPAAGLEPGEVLPVAVFTLLLWLQSEPEHVAGTGESLGESRALDRARSIATDVARADSVGNEARLADLFATFRRRR